jgi:signal transduction histidine kinase
MTRRLLGTYLMITAFVLLVLIVPLGRSYATREETNLLTALDRDATVVSSLVEDDLEAGRSVAIDPVLTSYNQNPGGRIVVVDTAGISVADSENIGGPPMDFSTRPEIQTALAGHNAMGRRPSETAGGDLLYVAKPIGSSGRVLGAVRITYPAADLNDEVLDNWLRLGLLSLVVLVAVAAVGIALARQVTRPVRSLEEAARALAAGDLKSRVPGQNGAPELTSLGNTFNEMAARIESLVDAQRSFVADASHQLRSPLTAMRLRLENLADTSAPEDRAGVEAAITEIHRLSRLVDGLLAIARAEAGTNHPVPVDLVAVAEERAAAWEALAVESGVEVTMQAPPTAPARAVPGAIEQILDNLLANALDATAEGGLVTVRIEEHGGLWELHVCDEGHGMPADDLERAFDRFYSKGKPGRGSGLGLAIVQQLANAGGGHAELRAAPGGGVDAVVTVPPARDGRSGA